MSSSRRESPERVLLQVQLPRLPLRHCRGPADPARPGDAEALLVESDLEPAGTFACSNDLFNRIHQVNLWTLRCLDLGGYMVGLSAPRTAGIRRRPGRHRMMHHEPRCGGLLREVGRRLAGGAESRHRRDPYTAPKYCEGGGGPAWGGAGCVLPWKLYLYYGDRRPARTRLRAMRRYVESLRQSARTTFSGTMAANGTSSATGFPRGAAWTPATGRPNRLPSCSTTAIAFTSGTNSTERPTALGRPEEARRCRAGSTTPAAHSRRLLRCAEAALCSRRAILPTHAADDRHRSGGLAAEPS